MAKEVSDLGLGILFSVAVTGQRNLLMLGAAMEAVRRSAFGAALDMQALGRAATTGVVGIGLLVAGLHGLKSALNLANETADFEYQMRHVTALGRQYGEDMSGMTNEVLRASMEYGMSAIDISASLKDYIRSGRSPSAALELLDPTLQLGRIGEMSPSQASDTILAVMNSMGLMETEIGSLVDMLAYSANQGWVTAHDFMAAFARFGPSGRAMNQEIEDMIAMFIMIKGQGMSASRAATMQRMLYTRLRAPSEQAARLLTDLGISLYKTSGEFRNVADIMDDVREAVSVGNLSEDLAVGLISSAEFQRELMEEGMDLRAIFSQRPLLGYDIITSGSIGDETGVGAVNALADNIRQNYAGYADTYMEELSSSYSFQKDQLVATWEALRIQIGIPLIKIFSSALKILRPLVEELYKITEENPNVATTVAGLAIILPLLATLFGSILIVKAVMAIKGLIAGVAGIKALVASLVGGAAPQATTAVVAAKSTLLSTVGVVLLAIAAFIALIFIVKWVVEAIKLYGSDAQTFWYNFWRVLLNTLIVFLNFIIEVVTAVLTTIAFLLRWLFNLVETIYNFIPGNNADITSWMGDTESWLGAREHMFGQFDFMHAVGYLDYQTPEGSRPEASGLYSGQADNLTSLLEQQRLLREGYHFGTETSAPQEEPVRGSALSGGFTLGSLNVTINAEGITNPERVGTAIVDALSDEVSRAI